MASTHRDVTLPVTPQDAFVLARNSGAQLPSFQLMSQDPNALRLTFYRGFGWSNPIDVSVVVWQSGPSQSTLRYQASLVALADPFDFMGKNLERFEQHLRAHHHAWVTGSPPPPPPVDTHSAKVNLYIIGVLLGVFLLIGLVVIVAAVAN